MESMHTKSGVELDTEVALAQLSARLFSQGPDALVAALRQALGTARALMAELRGFRRDARAILSRYDDISLLLGDAASITSVARNGHPDRAVRDAADTAEQEIESLATELSLDRGVYDALVAAQAEVTQNQESLDDAGRHLLDKVVRSMKQSGVDRDEATRDKVRGLRDALVLVGQEFGKNIIEDVRSIEVEPSELAGLPEDYIASHAPGNSGKVRITTDSTDYVPFITYARSSRAREALWRAYRQRAQTTNLPVLDRLLRRRHELATLLGYPSYAALATEDKMIGSADKAAAFIEEISAASGDRSARDYAQLLARRQKDEPAATQVEPWDASYLTDRVSHEQAGYSAQETRPYFEYARVTKGVLDTMSRLFGVRFVSPPPEEDVRDSGRWHESVELFDVVDAAREVPLGRIYLDMHPRDGKYKHYAQFTVRTGVDRPGRERLPEGALLCNFPDPSRGTALLELDQVRTYFHEFGHLMHHLLGGHTPWAGVSGVATEWDFVEAPSQLLEEWTWDRTTLGAFAVHHETGEPLPQALLDRARRADALGKGLWVRQQMLYAAVSLEYHRRDPETFDTSKLLAELQARYTPYRFIEGTAFQASFGHLSGYSAIYYTYMWSLVIAKDLFSKFTEAGLDDVAPARRYRDEVLAPGGSRPAAELCERFLGRPYEVGAYRAWLDGTPV